MLKASKNNLCFIISKLNPSPTPNRSQYSSSNSKTYHKITLRTFLPQKPEHYYYSLSSQPWKWHSLFFLLLIYPFLIELPKAFSTRTRKPSTKLSSCLIAGAFRLNKLKCENLNFPSTFVGMILEYFSSRGRENWEIRVFDFWVSFDFPWIFHEIYDLDF